MEEEALIEYIDSDEFKGATVNCIRLVNKLKLAIQQQELYETHQILRTIYYRLINKDKTTSLWNLLFRGAIYLSRKEEHVSAQDIGLLFLESAAAYLTRYRDQNEGDAESNLRNPSLRHHSNLKTVDWQIATNTGSIAAALPDDELGQSKFIIEALRRLTPKLLNRELLHHVMANEFWRLKNYLRSRYHFLHAASPENAGDIGKFLIEFETNCSAPYETDLFVTQFILQFLCLHVPTDPPRPLDSQSASRCPVVKPNPAITPKTRSVIKLVAEKISLIYYLSHPALKDLRTPGRPSQQPDPSCTSMRFKPLLTYLEYIISILDSSADESNTFKTLTVLYESAWLRDPSYQDYIRRIGFLYFGVFDKALQQQRFSGGFLDNILRSLMDGGDDASSDEEATSHQSQSQHATTSSTSVYDELD